MKKRNKISIIWWIGIVVITILLSYIPGLNPDTFFISTIYTVSGIIFSIGFSLIVTFNMGGAREKDFIERIRMKLHLIRASFLINFSFATAAYILNNYICLNKIWIISSHNPKIELNWPILFSLIIFYSIIYFIIGLINLQKLNYMIFDEVNKETM